MNGTLSVRPSRTAPTRFLLSAAVAGLALAGCRGNKSAEPPVHPNLNMDFQQNYKPQEENAWFSDKRAVRTLPAGAVAHDRDRSDVEVNTGRGADGRLLDGLPASVKLDDALLARGEERFGIYCSPCHEKSGYGHGIIVQRGLKVPPPSFHDPRLQAMPLGYFFDVITHGKGTMKPYASQVPVADRWAIAAWLRVLQVSQRAQIADIPDASREQLQRGTP